MHTHQQQKVFTGLFTNCMVNQPHTSPDGVLGVQPLHFNCLVSFCIRSQKSMRLVSRKRHQPHAKINLMVWLVEKENYVGINNK
jgi:hypothetical protein